MSVLRRSQTPPGNSIDPGANERRTFREARFVPLAAVRLLGRYGSLQLEEEVMRYRYEAGGACFGAGGSLPPPGIVN